MVAVGSPWAAVDWKRTSVSLLEAVGNGDKWSYLSGGCHEEELVISCFTAGDGIVRVALDDARDLYMYIADFGKALGSKLKNAGYFGVLTFRREAL